jgi:hypothetical protein
MLFNAKTPFYEPEEEPEGPEKGKAPEDELPPNDDDFMEVACYINKEGTSKWLFLDLVLPKGEGPTISSASFINSYEKEKADRKTGLVSAADYPGPILSSLDDKIQESLYVFVEGTGFTPEILAKVSEFSIAYEQKFYLEWLRDLQKLA